MTEISGGATIINCMEVMLQSAGIAFIVGFALGLGIYHLIKDWD
jgi:hypothetical protein